MIGDEIVDVIKEGVFVALGVGEGLDDVVDEGLEVVLFHVELLLEFLVFLLEVGEVVFGAFNGVPKFIGLVSDSDKIILEAVVLIVEFQDFFFEELDFFEEFLLFVLEVLFVGVVVDVFGEELFYVFLFL
jgi:hypothetical protein